jgi:uncharacterized protein (DUF1778 family)
MKLLRAYAVRNERLDVRLTAEEASYIAGAAAECSVTISDFIRDAVLKGSGLYTHGNRRVMLRDDAEMVRSLNAIGVQLRSLGDAMRGNGIVNVAQIDECLDEIRVALTRFES